MLTYGLPVVFIVKNTNFIKIKGMAGKLSQLEISAESLSSAKLTIVYSYKGSILLRKVENKQQK